MKKVEKKARNKEQECVLWRVTRRRDIDLQAQPVTSYPGYPWPDLSPRVSRPSGSLLPKKSSSEEEKKENSE